MNSNHNFFKSLLTATVLLVSAQILAASTQASTLEFLSPVPATESGSARWLASTEDKRLLMLDGELKPLAEYPGSYEQTSVVSVSRQQQLIAAVNQSHNSLDLFFWSDGQLTLLDRQVEPLLAVIGVCLYQDPASQDVHAFLLKEHTETEQRLVYQADKQRVTSAPIRTLPVPDGVESCAVDHQRQTLYFAEHNVGIWRMSAHPESVKNREPVAMAAPFGELQNGIESLMAMPDGTLMVPQEESVVVFHQDGNKQTVKVAGLQEVIATNRTSTSKIEILTGENLNDLKSVVVNIDLAAPFARLDFTQIPATAETDTVQRFGDAADDPAIWYNPKNPQASLILGTDKKRGLAVYNLNGSQLQFLEVGRINNVDLRAGFVYQQQFQVLAAASQRDNNSIALFLIDDAGQVGYKGEVATNLNAVYGLCMYQDAFGHYVFINDKDGRYQQYHIDGELNGKLVREFRLSNQPEGCVANDATGDLFVGVEDEGIWHLSARSDSKQPPQKIVAVAGPLKDDVEGMALYLKSDNSYLVVSSQGNDSYALYSATAPFDYITSINITANIDAGVDGASETDGLDVSSANFGGKYSEGLLVVQDGRNVMPQDTQNFKLVAFGDILAALGL